MIFLCDVNLRLTGLSLSGFLGVFLVSLPIHDYFILKSCVFTCFSLPQVLLLHCFNIPQHLKKDEMDYEDLPFLFCLLGIYSSCQDVRPLILKGRRRVIWRFWPLGIHKSYCSCSFNALYHLHVGPCHITVKGTKRQ